MNEPNTRERLEYLRGEIRAERISYSEIFELQHLAEHIPMTASWTPDRMFTYLADRGSEPYRCQDINDRIAVFSFANRGWPGRSKLYLHPDGRWTHQYADVVRWVSP